MTKQEVKKFVLVNVRSIIRKVYVSDLKAIIMRKKQSDRPRVPAFNQKPMARVLEVETEDSIGEELLPARTVPAS